MRSELAIRVDLRRIRTIVEVARAEAITTAAETLGLTQSAVSRSVAEVEESLGVRLFDRLPRGIQLTEAGQRFVARARRLLAEAEDLVSNVREPPGGLTGRLRVGVTACGEHAAWVMGNFAHEHPDVAIETIAGTPQDLCPELLRGELDLVLGASTFLRRFSDLEVTELAPLFFACMFRKDHPLAFVKKPSEEEVLRYPVIFTTSVESTYSDIAMRYVHHGLPQFRPRYVTSSFELIQRLVAKTDAFFPITHPSEAFAGLARDFLLVRDVLEMPTYHMSYARAPHRVNPPVVAALEELLVKRLGAPALARRTSPRRAHGRGLVAPSPASAASPIAASSADA